MAAFEAAKINAATAVDDSAQHDDGQYRPDPSDDDGSYKGEGAGAGGAGFGGAGFGGAFGGAGGQFLDIFN